MSAPLPTRYESKAVFMRRCMGSRSVLGAARADIADAMDRAEHDGPTLLTGAVPSPEGMRRSYCEILWEQQQRRFISLALQQGVVEPEEEASGTTYVTAGYVVTGYVV